MKKISVVLLGMALILVVAATGHAITGSLWQNQPTTITQNATLANKPITAPDAMFTPAAINYDSALTGYTPFLFLNSPTFFNTSVSFAPNASLDNTYFYFTGSTFLNAGANSFSVPHDDGLELNIDGIGIVLSQPGPTAPVTTPFTITAPSAGMYNFELSYGECCGPPATLAWTVNGAPVGQVPEPTTMLLLGLGLIGLAGVKKRFLE